MKKKLIVIIGPTCSQKNKIAMYLAKKYNGVIVNGDAFQVYKQINVGVNKPSTENLTSVPHYLINHIDYDQQWDVSIFQKKFYELFNELSKQNKLIILCGGSHLYIDSVISGYQFTEHNLDELIANKYEKMTNEELYNIIVKKDFPYSLKISSHNRRRMLRVCALMETENETMTNITARNKPIFSTLVIMANKKREEIYEAIDKRTEEMLESNWIAEVQKLVEKYGNQIVNSQCFKAIGYREIYNFLYENQPLNKELIKQKTRKLAKMQLTWCNNKFKNKLIFDINNSSYQFLEQEVEKFIQNEKE